MRAQLLSRVQLFTTLWTSRLLCPGDFSGKNTGVGCHFLLQGIFPTQGSNLPASPALQVGFFITEPPGKPCISSMANPISHYEIEIKQITHTQLLLMPNPAPSGIWI